MSKDSFLSFNYKLSIKCALEFDEDSNRRSKTLKKKLFHNSIKIFIMILLLKKN